MNSRYCLAAALFPWFAAVVLAAESRPLSILVMDPLSLQLSCACVKGTGQRRYDALAEHLKTTLRRKVTLVFDESLALGMKRNTRPFDLIVGKDAMVRFDADNAKMNLRPIAALTGRDGRTELSGVFIVRSDSGLKNFNQLAGKVIALGPVEEAETNGAVRRQLKHTGLLKNTRLIECGSIDSAALMVHDGEADAAVVSDFLPPLLEGCGKLDKGSVRTIGNTAGVPFIRVFAAAEMPAAEENQIVAALLGAGGKPELLDLLESGSGFRDLRSKRPASIIEWHDWRGPNRRGMVPQIPLSLPERPKKLWSFKTTGPAVSGVAANREVVIIADKSADDKRDVFRCVSADDGRVHWQIDYPAPKEMEYSNAPRATPVIHDGLVYLQGAFGELLCVDVASGAIRWRRNIFADFNTDVLNWGASSPPLVVGERLIINPGGKDASVVALHRKSGKVLWKTGGHAAAYSAFVPGVFGGVSQVVGYDSAGLGGWSVASGNRLWELVPPAGSDFNVLTPVVLGQRLLLGSENNATRLYGFGQRGRLMDKPVARNEDLAPDTCTPVVVNGKIYATAYGEMFCVRLSDMKTLWQKADDMFYDHSNVMGGPDRVLVWTMSGDLLLLDATVEKYRTVSHFRPFAGDKIDSMAHPAFVGDRIYLRSENEVAGYSLSRSE
jgi:outer membrane protein assembly factor BamB